MRYSGRWTAGLDAKEKQLFEDLLGANNKVLDRLKEICYNMCNESENNFSDYDNPNWPFRTADAVGYQRALKQVMKLLEPAIERDQR